jgi:hypothetical protein
MKIPGNHTVALRGNTATVADARRSFLPADGRCGSEVAERRRVLVIARDFPPCRLIGAQACAQNARYLPLYGWEPVVLTVRERYLESPDPNDRRTFPGAIIRTGVLPHPLRIYKKFKSNVESTSTSHESNSAEESGRSRSRIRRWILSLLQVPDIYTGWIPPATIAGLIAIHRRQIAHIFSSAPFFTNHLVGLVLASLTGLPWTVHLRDPWTQVERARAVSALSTKLEKWLERLVMSRADFVVCVTERHTRLLQQTFSDLPPAKFITIPNGYDEAEWNGSADRPVPRESGKFVITFAGSLYGTLSPRPLFRALRRLIDAGDVSPQELRVDLFGFCDVAEGIPMAEMAAESGLTECVHVGPSLSRPDTLRRMAASDLLLLLAAGLDLQIPGKTYEYLRAARPILAFTSDGALADLLQRTGGAWVVDPLDDAAVAAAVHAAYVDWKRGKPGRAADPAVVATFDRRLLSGRLAGLFESTSLNRGQCNGFERASEGRVQ